MNIEVILLQKIEDIKHLDQDYYDYGFGTSKEFTIISNVTFYWHLNGSAVPINLLHLIDSVF